MKKEGNVSHWTERRKITEADILSATLAQLLSVLKKEGKVFFLSNSDRAEEKLNQTNQKNRLN